MSHRLMLVGLALLGVILGGTLWACNVPVFRYALERWQSDPYDLVILHQSDLSEADLKKIETLRTLSRSNGGKANFDCRVHDMRESVDADLKKAWEVNRNDDNQPLVLLLFPQTAAEVPDRLISVTQMADLQVDHLAGSPLRTELAKRLLSGDSAVWIFVKSGNEEKDSAAIERLEHQILWNEKNLELPAQEEIEADEFFNRDNPIELRLDFSMIILDRSDPKERALLNMLLASEPDLEELDQPMAFPVIGRGRVLYALVGPGIYRETIAMASKFVVGPCSCQVKDQNPGFDLLMDTDWESKINGKPISRSRETKTKAPILIKIPPGK